MTFPRPGGDSQGAKGPGLDMVWAQALARTQDGGRLAKEARSLARSSLCVHWGWAPTGGRAESPLGERGPRFWGEACSVCFQTSPYPAESISRILTSAVQCSHGQPFSDLPALSWTIHFYLPTRKPSNWASPISGGFLGDMEVGSPLRCPKGGRRVSQDM